LQAGVKGQVQEKKDREDEKGRRERLKAKEKEKEEQTKEEARQQEETRTKQLQKEKEQKMIASGRACLFATALNDKIVPFYNPFDISHTYLIHAAT
jgi:hypothetical protein